MPEDWRYMNKRKATIKHLAEAAEHHGGSGLEEESHPGEQTEVNYHCWSRQPEGVDENG